MIKIIKQDVFSIDISKYQYTIVEKCHWFTSELFSNFSMPIDIPYNIHPYLQRYKSYSSVNLEMDMDVILDFHSKIYKASIEIQELKEMSMSVIIRWGFKELDCFKKDLSELNLEKEDVPNLNQKAITTLPKNYPETNYNFPLVYFPFYDKTNPIWSAYTDFVNLFVDGNFVQNVDGENYNEVYNYTAIQPLPHVLYILTKGFEVDGLTLKGDILTDEYISKAWVFTSKKLVVEDLVDNTSITVGPTEFQIIGSNKYYIYEQEILINGKFRVSGIMDGNNPHGIRFYLNNNIVYSITNSQIGPIEFAFEITTISEDSILKFEKRVNQESDGSIGIFVIQPIEIYNTDGSIVTYVASNKKINLNNNVPSMKFSEYVDIFRKWFNLDIDIINKEIHMNYIEEQIKKEVSVDLTNYEVKTPKRKPLRNSSWILKFKDLGSNIKKYTEYFIDKSGVQTEDFSKDKSTEIIEVNAIPLALEKVPKPDAFNVSNFANVCPIDDDSKLMIVLYNPSANSNTGMDNIPLLIPSIYENRYKRFLEFRINSIEFSWTFKKFRNQLKKLKKGSLIKAYNRKHVVKEIVKKSESPDVEEIEIITES